MGTVLTCIRLVSRLEGFGRDKLVEHILGRVAACPLAVSMAWRMCHSAGACVCTCSRYYKAAH